MSKEPPRLGFAQGLRAEIRSLVPWLLAVMLLPVSLSSGRMKAPRDIDFEVVQGLMIVRMETSLGRLKMVVDTGSNATTLDAMDAPSLRIYIDNADINLQTCRTRTPIFAQLNATLPADQRLDGILGQDFFSQFARVTFDYSKHRLRLEGKR